MEPVKETKKADLCYALALSGGASRGAYQAGVLDGLINSGIVTDQTFEYDVVTGVSAGARNGAMVSAFPKEKNGEMATYIKDYWG